MAKKTLKLEGLVFNFLKVIERNPEDPREWLCECVCGNICKTTPQRLRGNRSKSCGCMKSKLLSQAHVRHGGYSEGKNTPAYQSFVAMLHRCYDIKRQAYKNYGGRGITVCERWLEESPKGFLNFLEDMGERPEGTSLDRVDNEGNYSKENCRWSSRSTQANNRRRLKRKGASSKYNGVSYARGRWAARIGDGLGGVINIGYYPSEEEAAIAYNAKALEVYGESAYLNIVEKV